MFHRFKSIINQRKTPVLLNGSHYRLTQTRIHVYVIFRNLTCKVYYLIILYTEDRVVSTLFFHKSIRMLHHL